MKPKFIKAWDQADQKSAFAQKSGEAALRAYVDVGQMLFELYNELGKSNFHRTYKQEWEQPGRSLARAYLLIKVWQAHEFLDDYIVQAVENGQTPTLTGFSTIANRVTQGKPAKLSKHEKFMEKVAQAVKHGFEYAGLVAEIQDYVERTGFDVNTEEMLDFYRAAYQVRNAVGFRVPRSVSNKLAVEYKEAS